MPATSRPPVAVRLRRGLPIRAAAAFTLVALALAGCGGDDGGGTETFERDEFPFTFEYPGDLELTDELEFSEELGGAADESLALSHDDENALILERYTLNLEIDEDNLELAKRELDTLLQQVDSGAQGQEGETAGFPSLTYDSVTLPTPEEGESRYIALFDGDQEYLLNCQSTPDARDEIESACDQAEATLAPEGGG